jgi:anti-anti-sigma factor
MPSDHFRIHVEEKARILELWLPLQLDSLDIDQLRQDILRGMEGEESALWVIDLARTDYMGSAMLGLLVNIRHRILAGGGKIIVCSLNNRMTELFRASSIERLFPIARDRQEAME